MMEWIDFISSQLHDYWLISCTVIWFIAFLENVIPPIPGDLGILLMAFGSASDLDLLLQLFVSSTFGSGMGFMFLFYCGYWNQNVSINSWVLKIVSNDNICRLKKFVHRFGYGVILANRFFMGLRSGISFISGFSGLEPTKVFCMACVGAMLWNIVLFGIAWFFRRNWDLAKQSFQEFSWNLLFVFFSLILVLCFKKIWKRILRGG